MNRRGALIAVDTLIRLGIMLVVFAVVFLGILPVFQQKLAEAGETSKCEWSILLASVQKIGSAGIAEGIPEGCKAKQVQITMANLEKGQKLAKSRISSYVADENSKKMYNPQFFTDPDSKDQLLEFALDKIIADEMVACWEKVFKGNMPLFDQWWRLYDFPWSKTTEDAGQAFSKWYVPGTMHGPPVNCIICSRITFADDVLKWSGGKHIASLEEFLKNNPVPRTSTAYLQYLYEGQTGPDAFKPKYSFSVDEEGLAIMYERVNMHKTEETIKFPLRLLGLTSDVIDINHLVLVPYNQEKITSVDNGEGCTLIID
jgi:hypothetical protein